MRKAQSGDTVRVHYAGSLNDGSVFDSSEGRAPLEFTLGSGQVIPGFDEGVSGMELDERKQITIPAENAYGTRREDMVLMVDRREFPPDIQPEVGQQLQMTQGDQHVVVTVAEVSSDSVTLDANHPLAGEDLNFDLHLVEIVNP